MGKAPVSKKSVSLKSKPTHKHRTADRKNILEVRHTSEGTIEDSGEEAAP